MTDANSITEKQCKRCQETHPISGFNKDKNRSDGRFPYCRACTKAEGKKQYAKDPDKAKRQRRADYEKNKESYKERAKKWAEENPDSRREVRLTYDRANRNKKKIDSAKHRQQNPGMYRAHFKARQQRKRKAMPAWANEAAMKAIYTECQRISVVTGIKHHVDHFYPLKNPLVCGLHNEYNLRIIPAVENLSKGNRIPD